MSVSISPPGSAAPARPPPREPSLLDALAPVVVLIGLLALTIVLFGTAAQTTSRAHEKATGFPNDALVSYIHAAQARAGCPAGNG